jgi:pimeloyl-ACP methyl ester carboxylesterase
MPTPRRSVRRPATQAVGLDGPRLEGAVTVRDGRRLGFCEFGVPNGHAVVWLHGTPGARRQVPLEARRFASREGLRIIGIDRPGIGSSTPHQYESILDCTLDLEILLDCLGVGEVCTVGLSGGGPYALAIAAALRDRVPAVAVLGGVAPVAGPDRIGGGLVGLGSRLAPLISFGRLPLGLGLSAAVRLAHPVASPALDLYARLSPVGDRRLLGQPEFKEMFLDELLNGSRRQISAPLSDLILFTRDWGFRLADVDRHVQWWHGDADNIVPHAHGEHAVSRLPAADLVTLPGEGHLGGLGVSEQILAELVTHLP